MLRVFVRRRHKLFEARDIVDKLVGAAGLSVTLAAALLAAVVLLLISSDDPGDALSQFFLGPFANAYGFGNMLSSAVPLMLIGLGIALTFRASAFNLGGEGQVYAAGVLTAWLCLRLPGLGGLSGVLIAVTASAAFGAATAGLSGLLKVKWEVNELISSYLLSAALVLVCDYVVSGPLRDPGSSLQATAFVDARFRLPGLMAPSQLNVGLFPALVCLAAGAFYLFRTRSGYELRMCGYNPNFARYGGIHTGFYVVMPMAASGGLNGVAGALAALGTHHRAIQGFTAGLGWNGIAVALIAREHPAAVLPAALFYAYLEAGAKAAMIHSSVSLELVNVVQALIFYLITAQALLAFLERRGFLSRRARPKGEKP